MSSDLSFVEFVADQVVALICDNRLFVKPTKAGRSFIRKVTESPPYPGARPYFLIEDLIEDREWLSSLIRLTAQELPEPGPKRK